MIYFNNAADSFPKLGCVNQFLANPEYFLTGRECKCQTDSKKNVTEIFRSKIKEILNLPEDFQVTITHSATEAANLVIQSFFKQSKPENYVIYDHACHNSIIRPCEELYGSDRCLIHNNSKLEPCFFDSDSLLHTCICNRKISDCQMIIFSYESNVTGHLISNLRQLIEFIDFYGFNTPLILDITQAIGNTKIDLTELIRGLSYKNVYLFGTTHKSLGSISGTGFLIHPKENNLVPLIYGGTGTGNHNQPRDFPHYLESGTYDITSIVCANKALEYFLSFQDIECNAKSQLVEYFISKFNSIKSNIISKYVILQDKWINPSSGIINLFPKNENVGDFLATDLFRQGFVVRFGCHCCSRYKYVDSNNNEYRMSIRISFNSQNTTDEIDKFLEAFSNSIIELVKNDR